MEQLLVNRYEILEALGSGGFGDTYLAKDTQIPSQRPVVVKHFKPANSHSNTSTELIKKLFDKEAAVLEELGNNSNQIPKLYSYFSNNGNFYLVQEYIDGVGLDKFGKINSEQAKVILSSLLTTLKYVHGKGIIHRDIKPENIIIRNSDHLPVLIDFGAVKETMGTVTLGSGSTISSVVIGTRGFMAPEQSAGRSTFSSDLYSLGLTIIYALTQKLPVEFSNSQLTGELEWRGHIPDIDPSLAKILDKAIQLHLNFRYTTAVDMYNELHSLTINQQTLNENVGGATAETIKLDLGRQNSSNFLAESSAQTELLPTNTNHDSNARQKSSNGILIPVLLGVLLIAIGLGGGAWVTYQVQQAEERIAQANREKEEAERQRLEAERKIAKEQQAKLELEQQKIAEERQRLAAEAERARQERQRLEQAQNNIISSINNNSPSSSSPELSTAQASAVIEDLYAYLSSKNYADASALYGSSLKNSFTPSFFNQFDRVTVKNLEVISQSSSTVDFMGFNTYYYPDGTSQRERRSYQVSLVDSRPLITDSVFVRVTRPRK